MRLLGLWSFCVACFCLLAGLPLLNASSEPTLLSSELKAEITAEFGTDEPLNPTVGYTCRPHTFLMRNIVFTEEEYRPCSQSQPFGMLGGDLLHPAGSTKAGYLKTPNGNATLSVIGIPSSTSVLRYYPNSHPVGQYAQVIDNFSWQLDLVEDRINNTASYHLKQDFSALPFQKPNGELLNINTSSLSLSAGGDWLIVDSPGYGIVRVNTKTPSQTVNFAPPLPYQNGSNPFIETAVSSSGQLAVVTSPTYGILKIYDLDTCQASSGDIQNCQSRNLLPAVTSVLPELNRVLKISFLNNETLKLLVTDSDHNVFEILVAPVGSQLHKMDYLALGDSFSSGEGAHNYRADTDTQDNRCHLSTVSYPYLLKGSLSLESQESVACSGAKIEQVKNISITKFYNEDYPQAKGGSIEPSFIDSVISNYLPGYAPQALHSDQTRHHPARITISMGGNDIDFADKIKACSWIDTCYNSYRNRYAIEKEIVNQYDRLVQMYVELHNNQTTDVYVVGYPSIVSETGSCAKNVTFNETERKFANQLVHFLNQVIEAAAKEAGVFYIDIENSLYGHRLCETEQANIAVNGVTGGNDAVLAVGYPMGKESFHPNKKGHELMAVAIAQKSNNLTAPMPSPAYSNTPLNHITERLTDGFTKPDTEFNVPLPISGNPANYVGEVYDIGQGISDNLKGYEFNTPPHESFRLELHSEPLFLGEFTSDGLGNISYSVNIPEGVEPGPHSLHVYGKNIAGEPIDIYRQVWITASPEDADGDGILNVEDSCNFFDTGIDEDLDGIDDGCDNLIELASVIDTPGSAPKKPMSTNPKSLTNLLNQSLTSATFLTSTINNSADRPQPGQRSGSKSSQKNAEDYSVNEYLTTNHIAASSGGFTALHLVLIVAVISAILFLALLLART